MQACKAGNLQPGRVFTFATDMLNNPRYIINFPTKRHWRGRSRIEDIQSGLLRSLKKSSGAVFARLHFRPLGVGTAGLLGLRYYP